MATFMLDIVTPERKVFSGEVEFVGVKGFEGELGVMANHMPLVTPLKIGSVKVVLADKSEQLIAVCGGFLEVRGKQASILAETAELPEEIDIDRALRAKERAEERLKNRHSYDTTRAEIALQRALMRLKVSGRM